jgi:5-oxoprolinase (ATP-hydrolysing)
VTDANLCLGRLLPEYFPKIFGPSENEPLDKAATSEAFYKLTEEVDDSHEFCMFVCFMVYLVTCTM